MRYHVSIIHETGHLREYDVFPGSLLSLPDEIAMLWTDTTTPRTDAPVRFMYSLSNAYTYRQARIKSTGSGKAFLGYRA